MLEYVVTCAVGVVFIVIACNGVGHLYDYLLKRWK